MSYRPISVFFLYVFLCVFRWYRISFRQGRLVPEAATWIAKEGGDTYGLLGQPCSHSSPVGRHVRISGFCLADSRGSRLAGVFFVGQRYAVGVCKGFGCIDTCMDIYQGMGDASVYIHSGGDGLDGDICIYCRSTVGRCCRACRVGTVYANYGRRNRRQSVFAKFERRNFSIIIVSGFDPYRRSLRQQSIGTLCRTGTLGRTGERFRLLRLLDGNGSFFDRCLVFFVCFHLFLFWLIIGV